MIDQNTESTADMWRQWVSGIQYEINFWNRWFSLNGGHFKEDFERRLKPDSEIDDMAARVISRFESSTITILDVGAGPITCLGKKYHDRTLNIVATDPLAQQYNDLIKTHSIATPLETSFALAEELYLAFDADFFDIVHCQNALDHSIDPVRAVLQMLTVCKIGGYVMLRHAHNEAEHENYAGFHQWNLTLEGDDFIVWNRKSRVNLSSEISGFAQHEVIMSDGYIINLFKKMNDVPYGLSGDNRKRQFSFQKAAIRSLGDTRIQE